MGSIYISYRKSDQPVVEEMVHRLERLGYKNIFVDFHESKGLLGGSDFTQVMFERMEEADIFMPLLSRNWHDSKWVFAELYLARFLKKKLLPVAVEAVDMREFPQGLSNFMAVDFHTSRETGVRRLDIALRSLGADPREGFPFKAFLSYARADGAWADALREGLMNYQLPERLQGKKTDLGAVPPTLGRFFRDTVNLGAEQSLTSGIRRALQDAEFLIVLCSPNAFASKWVNQEIELFRQIRDDRNILAVLVDGAKDGLEASFPPALSAEPLAPDIAYHGVQGVIGRIAAAMTGLPFDELERAQAEEQARALSAARPRTKWWRLSREA